MFEGSVSKNRHLMIDVITLNHTVRCSRNSGRDCAARFYSSPPRTRGVGGSTPCAVAAPKRSQLSVGIDQSM